MGPSVKLFRASMVHSQKKKIMGDFFLFVKTPNRGGRGRFGKSPHFLLDFFFFETFPKHAIPSSLKTKFR